MAADLEARMSRLMSMLQSINGTAGLRLTGGDSVPASLREAMQHTVQLLEGRKPVQKQDPEEFARGRDEREKSRAAANKKRKADLAVKRVRDKLTLPPGEDPEAEEKKGLHGAPALSHYRRERASRPAETEKRAAPIADKTKKAERTFRTLIKDKKDQVVSAKTAPGGRWQMSQPRGELPGQFRAAQARKGQDLSWLEKERQRRSGIVGKAGKLARMRGKGWGAGENLDRGEHHGRARHHDEPKGYEQEPAKLHEPRSRAWSGHHVGGGGQQVHSSGKKANKKFANATTFRDSDTDALLHTDKSASGARGDADTNEFVFHGDVKKDPRQKWYRVSKEGGYAAAMASLGKSYHKSPDMRSRVVAKVKETGFVDGSGHQIDVKPTGALHNERGACVRDHRGVLNRSGRQLQRQNPQEWSRLCKGAHGSSGTPTRNEYTRGFDPRHDDASKVRKLHKAAETGKADKPDANIAAHAAARPGRRQDIHDMARHVGRAATRTRWQMRNG